MVVIASVAVGSKPVSVRLVTGATDGSSSGQTTAAGATNRWTVPSAAVGLPLKTTLWAGAFGVWATDTLPVHVWELVQLTITTFAVATADGPPFRLIVRPVNTRLVEVPAASVSVTEAE